MRVAKLMNPVYVYKRREHIVPFVKSRAHRLTRPVRDLPHTLAAHGLPVTANDRKLASLKDKYKGQRCFILGNGPSLKQQDIGLLRNEFVFVTNWFVLHDEFLNLQNCFFCASDAHLWNYGGGFHPELPNRISKHKNIVCFFEHSALSSFRRQSELKEDVVLFVQLNDSKRVWEGHFSSDVVSETYWGYTVIIDMCLPLAFYLGFETVYLMGCDCDYKLDEARDFSKSFFYDISKVPESDLAHISKQREEANAQEQLDKWEKGYMVVKDYFEGSGRKIFNAGYGGKLEVFERVNYDDLF